MDYIGHGVAKSETLVSDFHFLYGEQYGDSLKKLKVELLHDATIPPSRHVSGKL